MDGAEREHAWYGLMEGEDLHRLLAPLPGVSASHGRDIQPTAAVDALNHQSDLIHVSRHDDAGSLISDGLRRQGDEHIALWIDRRRIIQGASMSHDRFRHRSFLAGRAVECDQLPHKLRRIKHISDSPRMSTLEVRSLPSGDGLVDQREDR